MKYKFFLVVLLVSSSRLLSQQETLVCKDFSTIAEREGRAQAPLLNLRSAAETGNYDLKYHRLEWMVDPAVRYIEGVVTSYFVPKEANFQQMHFELSDSLTVSEVRYREQAVSFARMGDDLLRIELPAVLPAGQLDSISVSYQGIPPETDFGSFALERHDAVPVLWTLSEPYGAKDWWPCKQDLNDKIDSIDVLVRTPGQYRVASNGVLVNEITDGEEKIYHWRHRHPIPAYLIAIGVTNYAVFSDFVPVENGDSIEVLNYVYPEDGKQIKAQVKSMIAIMQLFSDLFGLYPFADEKYGHAQFGWSGGMEHQTMSFMGAWTFSLQAHELAHQWFGNKVTCGSWEDIWLNEGFATYLEGLTYEYGLGDQEWHNWLEIRRLISTLRPDGSVWVFDTTDVDRIFDGRLSYSKGAMLLHMLRWKLGDEPFFQALRNYLDDPRLAYGYARTQDLKAHLEAQSGQDLTEFFKDWFYGEGYPSYTVHWEYKSGSTYQVQIFQSTSHPSVDFFEMPVPILFRGQGQESLQVFDHRFSGQIFERELPFTLEEVIFDPDLWILSRDNVVENQVVAAKEIEAWRRSLCLYPNPARDQITLSFEDWPEMPLQMVLMDIQGRVIRRIEEMKPVTTIQVGALPAGEYVLRVYTPEGPMSRTFLKK